MPFSLADAIDRPLADRRAYPPLPGVLFFAGAESFGATVMMPALKKPYPTGLVAPVRRLSSGAVCPAPYFARSIRLLCLR